MLKRIEDATQREHGVGLVPATADLRGIVEELRRPPAQRFEHPLPQFLSRDGVNQGLRGGTSTRDPAFPQDTAVNRPGAIVQSHLEPLTLAALDVRVQRMGRVIAPERVLREVGAFQLDGPRQVDRRDAVVHDLQCRKEIA
jgi:hypothetical protein